MVWESPSPLVTTLDARSLKKRAEKAWSYFGHPEAVTICTHRLEFKQCRLFSLKNRPYLPYHCRRPCQVLVGSSQVGQCSFFFFRRTVLGSFTLINLYILWNEPIGDSSSCVQTTVPSFCSTAEALVSARVTRFSPLGCRDYINTGILSTGACCWN